MMPKSIAKLVTLPDDVRDAVRDIIAYEVAVDREANARMVEDCYTLPTGEANKLAARIRARPAP